MTDSQNGVSAATTADAPDIDRMDTGELLALRVELREQISRLFSEKQRLNGQIHAIAEGTAWAGTRDERWLRAARRTMNTEITAKTALLDRIKLRLFAMQNAPRPKGEPTAPSRATTPDERAARLARLDEDGPDQLLLRVAVVVRRVLDGTGTEMLGEKDRRTLGDLSFYLRQKFGSPKVREREGGTR